jgi:hypothetical protein
MTLAREFMSALAMLRVPGREREPRFQETSRSPLPCLDRALASIPSVPEHAILLGVGSEGMPLMLDLRDPSPGPVLVVGDAASGKTDLLRSVAAALIRSHGSDEVQFCTLTPEPAEWGGFEAEDHCLGVLAASDPATGSALERLAYSIREERRGSRVLLLVDDLPAIDHDALGVLAWGLVQGPAVGLWPLVTLNTLAVPAWSEWVALFQTRIFAHMDSTEAARDLTPALDGGLHNLLAGAQFALRSQGHWLRFWAPLA